MRERLGALAGTLSGGEQQMVAMARALMGRPRLICMDEPTMGLSPLYVEVAFAESVIHECGRFVGASYEVPVAELTERSVVRFACDRRKSLVLADLTGAALKALGLNNDISASADYAAS